MTGGIGAAPGMVMGAFAGGMKGVAGKATGDIVRKQHDGESFTQSVEDVSGDILGEGKEIWTDYDWRDHISPGSVTREADSSNSNNEFKY